MQRTSQYIRFIVMVATAIAILVSTSPVSAALVKCRTDPIFQLSNGDRIVVTLDINTDAINVRNVTYVLHVPAGVTVTRVTYTAGGLGTKEVYRVYQDSVAKTYRVDSLVTVQNTGAVAMVATAKLNSLTARTASGYTGQYVIVTVSKP